MTHKSKIYIFYFISAFQKNIFQKSNYLNMIPGLFKKYSLYSRKKRAKIFHSHFNIGPDTTILDLGGGTGNLIDSMIEHKHNVYIADFDKHDLALAKKKGFNIIELDESGRIPIEKNQFDIIFSNSVLEHVTVDKKDVYTITDNKEFYSAAIQRQKLFADEIRAKSDKYYVQTPYKFFILESHSWLPGLIVLLPRKLQIGLINFTNKFWVKQTIPDFNLLTYKEMQALFPDAKIIKEKSVFMVKSLIAIKA